MEFKQLPIEHVKKIIKILQNSKLSDTEAWNDSYGVWHNSIDWGRKNGQFEIPYGEYDATLQYDEHYDGFFKLYDMRKNTSVDGLSRKDFEKVLVDYKNNLMQQANSNKVIINKVSSDKEEIERLKSLLKKNKIKF